MPSDALDADEALQLVGMLAAGGAGSLVLGGGDPLARPDVQKIVSAAAAAKLAPELWLGAAAPVDRAGIVELKDAGLSRLGAALHAPTAEAHDASTHASGSFDDTLAALKHAYLTGVATRVLTRVTRDNADDLRALGEVVRDSGARGWVVTFAIPWGTGSMRPDDPQRAERALSQLVELGDRERFDITVLNAPQHARLRRQRGNPGATALNDGRGILCITHDGDILPSPSLRRPTGNVRNVDPMETYRTAPLFRLLRDPTATTGNCSACAFRGPCGGSRARSFAASGSVIGPDPLCAYTPGTAA